MTESERRFLYTQTIYIYTTELTLVCWKASVWPVYCWLQFRYLFVCACVCSGSLGEQAENPFSTASSNIFERLACVPAFLKRMSDSVPCGLQGDIKNNVHVPPSVFQYIHMVVFILNLSQLRLWKRKREGGKKRKAAEGLCC